MKCLFSSPDPARIGLAQSLLDAAGIKWELRNEAVSQAEIGMPFATEVWVLYDKHYKAARDLIQSDIGQTRSFGDIRRRPMKRSVLPRLLALLAVFAGCQRSFHDAEVVGAWQVVERRVEPNDEVFPSWHVNKLVPQTFTFYSNHNFTAQFVSAKDLRHFGVWAIESNCLAMTVLSNSVFPTITSNRESARIISLTESMMTLENRDPKDRLQQRVLRRIK